jgi:hypothetical protein
VTTSAAPPPAPIEFGALFARSWEVFKRNWIVALPPILGGIVITIIVTAFIVAIVVGAIAANTRGHASAASAGFAGLAIVGSLVLLVLIVVIALWTQIATYAMADAAWMRGSASFTDGFAAFPSRVGALFVAMIGLFGLMLVALILMLPTLTLSVIAFTFVTMFVLPAVVAGRRGGFEAIAESFRLIRRFFVPSIITWLVLYAIQYAISFLMVFAIMPVEFAAMPAGSDSMPQIPPIPLIVFSGALYIAAIVALMAYTGFQAVALVGLYRELSAQPEPPPAQPWTPPPPGSPAGQQY